MRKIFKIFSFFVLCLFIFCSCAKSNSDINSTLSDTDVENLLNVYHKGGILQRICSINDLDENDLIQFYYYTNEDKLSNTQDYKLNLSDFKNYISNYFDISKFDFGKSYYYRYLVDETTKTYMMSYRKAFSQTKKDGNISKKGDIYLYCDADSRSFQESDDDGKLIKKFKINKKIKRVYKDDWKNFWFV